MERSHWWWRLAPPQEPAEITFDPQLKFGLPLVESPDINWSPGGGELWDGFHVDLVGAPMGSDGSLDNNGATIVIPNPGNVDRIRVQVQIKGGTDDEPYT